MGLEVVIGILGVIATVLGFLIPMLKKRIEVKNEDHTALHQLGATEFNAGVTGGVQQSTPPLQPK